MAQNKHWEQDKEATVYIGNLDERVTDAIVWELMLQAGRIVNVHLPKDRVTQTHQGFGFVEFISEEDAEYAARIMNQIRLYGKPIRVNKASADKQKTTEIGAELFVGNLDPMVDEKTLFETFSTFGGLVAAPKIARDESGASKGYGFISYDSFEASDKAIESMNGQYLMNKEISVQYAYKKDGKGERHGDQAERLLAAQARKNNVQLPTQTLPPQLFAPSAPNPASAAVVVPTSIPQIPVAPAAMAGMGGMGGHARQGGPPAPPGPPMGMPPHHAHAPMPYQLPTHPPPPAPQSHLPRPPPTGPSHHPPQPPQQPQQPQQPHQPPHTNGPPSGPTGLPPRPPPPVGFGAYQPSYPPFSSQGGAYGGGAAPPLPAGFGGRQSGPPQAQPFGMQAPPPGFPQQPMGVPPPQGGYQGYGRGR
ncbi:hypothetical protein EV426DRAFT_589971 [Tirmania nivea]|nr:hypothetical protein EV426DRAFT_589971 [Tirmania nivea]